MSSTVDQVVIGMDPHKRSATIEVMAGNETIVGTGRFSTGREGYAAMTRYTRQWPNRIWAIEGCQGIGRHIANRLLRDGEQVVDVPPKLSARARVFATGQGRKTDATDAHFVALVGTRMAGLHPLVNDEQLALLRILVDRRRSLGEDHTRMVSQLHQLLLELILGGAKKKLSAAQAKALLATVKPRDPVGKARRRVAAELIADLERVYQRSKEADKVGEQVRHRLSRAGNRQINRVLHIMATVQLRNPAEERAYFDRKKAAGKTSMEAMRSLKRRLSDIVYRKMLDGVAAAKLRAREDTGDTSTDSSATDSHPHAGSSELITSPTHQTQHRARPSTAS